MEKPGDDRRALHGSPGDRRKLESGHGGRAPEMRQLERGARAEGLAPADVC